MHTWPMTYKPTNFKGQVTVGCDLIPIGMASKFLSQNFNLCTRLYNTIHSFMCRKEKYKWAIILDKIIVHYAV